MSRRLFSRLISCWTRNPRDPGMIPGPNWPEASIRPRPLPTAPNPCRYPAEQLDELHDLIAAHDDSGVGSIPPSARSGEFGLRQAASPHIVDRAIADLTNPRRRSRRLRY